MREPVRSRPFGDSPCEAIQTMTFSGNDRLLQPFSRAVALRFLRLILGHLPEREFPQRREIAFAKEIVERLLDLLDAVDFALPQTVCAACLPRHPH